jgi:hypothetical protein
VLWGCGCEEGLSCLLAASLSVSAVLSDGFLDELKLWLFACGSWLG